MGIIIILVTVFLSQQVDKLGLGIDCEQYKKDLYGAYKAQRWIDSLQPAKVTSETYSLELSDNMICFCKEQTNSGSSPQSA